MYALVNGLEIITESKLALDTQAPNYCITENLGLKTSNHSSEAEISLFSEKNIIIVRQVTARSCYPESLGM